MRNLARAIFGELEVFREPNPNRDLLNSGTVVHLDKKKIESYLKQSSYYTCPRACMQSQHKQCWLCTEPEPEPPEGAGGGGGGDGER